VAYQNEDAIKAQLRALTEASRKAREELDVLLRSGGVTDLTRGMVHAPGKVQPDPPAVTHDRRRKSRKRA
jgi:hypothetical protein